MKQTIQNTHLEACINEYGAELTSLRDKNSNIEYMWQADENHWARHAPILFPIVGKLKNNTYQYNEHSLQMSQHGFARDALFHVVDKSDDAITLELTDNKTSLLQYPVHFVLQVTYQLEGRRLLVKFRVFNTDTKQIHFSIGGHPAFNCPVQPDGKRSDYHLLFEKSETAKAYMLENGLLTEDQQDVIKNGDVLPISDDLFAHDALVFKNLHSSEVTLVNNMAKRILTLEFPDTPYFGVWSKSDESPFVCLEPWFGLADHIQSDGNFTNKEGIIALSPEAIFKCQYSILIH